ncbi:unnamed protein product, partial [Rotaria sp. Silwood1]
AQLGILAELLSTFQLCLNDNYARAIHVSLNALQTSLNFLLINSHAFIIIGIELLEDSIQHSTSFHILAKVALAQLTDDIDFRTIHIEYISNRKKNIID